MPTMISVPRFSLLPRSRRQIFQMHPLKALGHNGLPTLFFQMYWHIVGSDVQSLNILNNQVDPFDINKTFIVLIPKCKNPTSPKEFRHISLCNLLWRLWQKWLLIGLRKLSLMLLTYIKQSTFVQGRLITDSALIVMECFHWLKKKRKGEWCHGSETWYV